MSGETSCGDFLLEPGSDQDSASITVYPDGPLLVRGDVAIRTPDGQSLDNPRGTVALCRCGKSTIKPWCDGTHKLSGFRATRPGAAPQGPARP